MLCYIGQSDSCGESHPSNKVLVCSTAQDFKKTLLRDPTGSVPHHHARKCTQHILEIESCPCILRLLVVYLCGLQFTMAHRSLGALHVPKTDVFQFCVAQSFDIGRDFCLGLSKAIYTNKIWTSFVDDLHHRQLGSGRVHQPGGEMEEILRETFSVRNWHTPMCWCYMAVIYGKVQFSWTWNGLSMYNLFQDLLPTLTPTLQSSTPIIA